MYANNETGTIFPIEEIGVRVKEYGAIFHVDAVQAVGKIPLNMKTSTIDMLTISGHKIHAPKGIGALYVRRGVRFRPFLVGGHQERGRRAGTENVPGIIALGKAAELELSYLVEAIKKERKLRDYLEESLLVKIPDCEVNGDIKNRLPNTTNIGFKYIEGEAILLSLNSTVFVLLLVLLVLLVLLNLLMFYELWVYLILLYMVRFASVFLATQLRLKLKR